MGRFRWLGAGSIPATYDLRRCGWTLIDGPGADVNDTVSLLPAEACDAGLHIAPPRRRSILVLAVAEPCRRAALLHGGFGDVLGPAPDLTELAARAARLSALVHYEPRLRHHGALVVDLLARDGFVEGRAVGLHPREFALLWRLMAAGGEPVGKVRLLAEVWHLGHVPETNSLPVHVSRLRSKLAAAGFPAVVATRPGGYAYVPQVEPSPAMPLSGLHTMDAHVRITDEATGATAREER